MTPYCRRRPQVRKLQVSDGTRVEYKLSIKAPASFFSATLRDLSPKPSQRALEFLHLRPMPMKSNVRQSMRRLLCHDGPLSAQDWTSRAILMCSDIIANNPSDVYVASPAIGPLECVVTLMV